MARQSAPMSLALCVAFLTLAASKTAPGTVRLTDSGGVEIPHSSCGTTGGYLQVFDGVRWGFVGSSECACRRGADGRVSAVTVPPQGY